MAGHDIIVLSREHLVSALLNHTYRCLDKTDYATNVAVRLINFHSKHTGCLMRPYNGIAFGKTPEQTCDIEVCAILYCSCMEISM